MARVLLLNPPQRPASGSVWKGIDRSLPPLGLAALAAYLRRAGHVPHLIDLAAEPAADALLPERVREFAPDLVGVTVTTVQHAAAVALLPRLRAAAPHARLVAGGAHPSVLPDDLLIAGYDVAVLGEGEETLNELADGRPPAAVAGLAFRDGSVTVRTPSRALIPELDDLPAPAYDLLRPGLYRPSTGNWKQLPALSMVTTRGCPGRCTFCYTGVFGSRVRRFSAGRIADDIGRLRRDYGIREISFYDDTFTVPPATVRELCELLLKRNVRVSWSCMSRADCVDAELLALMRRAGCHQVGYGLESVDPGILAAINKPMPVATMRAAIRQTKAAGLTARVMFMLGNPGETAATMEQNLQFCLDEEPDLVLFNIATPLPGTALHRWAKEQGYLLTENWDAYDLARPLMNLPTVSTEAVARFYRTAYRRFYGRPRYLLRRLRAIRTPGDIRREVQGLLAVAGVG